MATYYDIFGQKVQYLASDPNPVQIGQVWYNSTSNTAKFQGATAVEAWSSGGNRNDAITSTAGGGGTATDTLSFGGYQPPSNPSPTVGVGYSRLSELYDGTTWTVTSILNSGRSGIVGFGASSSASIAANGYADNPGGVLNLNVTEGFDGSTWTSLNNSNTNKEGAAGSGIYNAGFSCTGAQPNGAGNEGTANETWDGTCWTTANPTTFATQRAGSAGTLTAAVIAGGQVGYPDSKLSTAAEYDGTCWSSATSLPGTRAGMSKTRSPQVAAVMFGGYGGTATPLLRNLNYDGSAWTTGATMARPASDGAGASGDSSGLIAAGGGTYTTTTEEYFGAGTPQTKTITTS